MPKINFTSEDMKKLTDYNIQLLTVGCLDSNQARDFNKLIYQATEKLKQLEEWYESLMKYCVSDGCYKCNHCGGPVAVGRCCAWCGNTSPSEPNPTFDDDPIT